jgi:large subunit ribosomal protein L1
MPPHSKKLVDAHKRYDAQRLYSPVEALELVKSLARANFDETVELAVVLGVDPRKADQIVRGTVSLPAGSGKPVRVAVFATGQKAEEARAAGADFVGADDLVERVQGGWFDFDVAIATPDMMGQVGKVARILGPRKLMPNPKAGTVTMDVARAVAEFKGGKVEYRADAKSHGVAHVPIGKASFSMAQLLQNFRAVTEELLRAKPAAAKGRYITSITVSSTMGPGVKIDPARMRLTDEELAGAAA